MECAYIVGEHRTLIAFFGALAHVSHIVADARNAQQARFLIPRASLI